MSEVEERDDELPRVDAREQQVDADVHCQQVQVLSRQVEVLTLHTTSDTTSETRQHSTLYTLDHPIERHDTGTGLQVHHNATRYYSHNEDL